MTAAAVVRLRPDDPLTPNQLGAAHREFERLGFRELADRADRLRVTADLLGLPGVATFKDLTMGQAGRLVGTLRRCRTPADLYALADQAPAPEPAGPSLVDAIAAFALALAYLCREVGTDRAPLLRFAWRGTRYKAHPTRGGILYRADA